MVEHIAFKLLELGEERVVAVAGPLGKSEIVARRADPLEKLRDCEVLILHRLKLPGDGSLIGPLRHQSWKERLLFFIDVGQERRDLDEREGLAEVLVVLRNDVRDQLWRGQLAGVVRPLAAPLGDRARQFGQESVDIHLLGLGGRLDALVSLAAEVDVRVVCATHRDLARLIREGAFRQDLLYRLKVLTIEMPGLRERRDDILPLALHFLEEEKSRARGFSAAARKVLLNYAWPGNVRELQNAVKHGAALAMRAEVHDEDLPDELKRSTASRPSGTAPDAPRDVRTLAEMERAHVLQVLDACGGSQSEAARILGVARNTLWRKLKTYS